MQIIFIGHINASNAKNPTTTSMVLNKSPRNLYPLNNKYNPPPNNNLNGAAWYGARNNIIPVRKSKNPNNLNKNIFFLFLLSFLIFSIKLVDFLILSYFLGPVQNGIKMYTVKNYNWLRNN